MTPTVSLWVLEKFHARKMRQIIHDQLNVGSPVEAFDDASIELLLLRLLTLERELRQASLLRNRESCAMLTRAIVESSLIGLYILVTPGTVDRLMRESMKRFGSTLEQSWRPFPEFEFREVMESMGVPLDSRGMPDYRQVAERVDRDYEFPSVMNQPLGSHLYWQWFVPLSNFSVHGTAASISRYYKPVSARITARPWGIVPRRGAIRVSDGCICLLGAELAKRRGGQFDWLESNGIRLVRRANVPMVVVFSQLLRGLRLRHVLRIAKRRAAIAAAAKESSTEEGRQELMRVIGEVLEEVMNLDRPHD